MKINKLLTTVNYKKVSGKSNKYLVLHYVGATGGAEANCKYFKDVYRGASAHYFVGHNGEVWQCIEDNNIAWHCGANNYVHKYCRNSNSIGIEMCCKIDKSGKWYFTDATVKAAIELTRELMRKYNIPVANVLRHFDVTAKNCPEPYVRDNKEWIKFKNSLIAVDNVYKVRITAEALNVRAGAGIQYKVNTVVKKNEVYTIVDTVGDWGKLKSGAGWINLKYTKLL